MRPAERRGAFPSQLLARCTFGGTSCWRIASIGLPRYCSGMVRGNLLSDRPTFGDLRKLGMSGLTVACTETNCGHTARLSFEEIGMRDTDRLIDLPRDRRFRCIECGGGKIEIAPDWSTEQPMSDVSRLLAGAFKPLRES